MSLRAIVEGLRPQVEFKRCRRCTVLICAWSSTHTTRRPSQPGESTVGVPPLAGTVELNSRVAISCPMCIFQDAFNAKSKPRFITLFFGHVSHADSKMHHNLMLTKMMGMWRRKSGRAKDDDKFALPTTDDLIPMETREQEELVMSFELSLERQSRMWKNVFQALFCAYIFFMGYSMYQQIQSPWELRYHAYFENEVDSMSVIFEDGMAIIACAVAIYGLSRDGKYQKLYILSSIIFGIVVAIFWLYQMMRLPKFRWDVLWLPITPLCCSLVSLYVIHLHAESQIAIQKLRNSMYEYKRR
ncbi:unnamed protein product [Rhodiola kirilowii]